MGMKKYKKIRLSLQSYSKDLINVGCEKIEDSLKDAEVLIRGPIYLPTKRRIYCVLRSPHVDKKSREHLEIRTYKRFYDIFDLSQNGIDPFLQIQVPCGISFNINVN